MRKALTMVAAVAAIAFALPSYAAEPLQPTAVPAKVFKVSAPAELKIGQSKNMSVRPKTAQVFGAVCRNGFYYCVGVGSGPVGGSCCGCGFCGWWSTW